jgi:hydroxymethylpyrimidine pyrophosphatase-like HAD family hydrolase/energy-coupling factor transporter ATP-binding protein EcfA2
LAAHLQTWLGPMRFLALACDYDGTIATHGLVDDATIAALRRFRASGRRLILVTGRELDDLERVCPDLALFDRVVAENGAVLHDPHARTTRDLATAPPGRLVQELQGRGVTPLSVGRVIVATWEPQETVVLEAIRDLQLELQVIFNKGAVMVLPSGINKASGLQAQLQELGLSAHNVVGIGDAENDHAFLSACECSVAVANALQALKERVDLVTAGDHGRGVIELIDRMLKTDLAELEPALARHCITVGVDEQSAEVRLRPYGETVMVAGPSGSGKSTITTSILEGLCARRYQFCIIDPEGDYHELDEAVSLRGSDERALADEAMQVLASPDQNLVLNLVDLKLEDRPPFFQRILPLLLELRARTARPHWVVIDEAHHLLPVDWEPATHVLPGSLGSVLMVTVHPEHVYPPARELMQSLIALGDDVSGVARDFAGNRSDLQTDAPTKPERPGGWTCLFRPGASPRWIDALPPKGERKRHQRKYAEGELGPDKSFYFRGADGRLNLRSQNLAMFTQIAEGVDDETWLHHLRKGDYSRWFRESIKDESLAQAAAAAEEDMSLSASESRSRILGAIEERYTSSA